MHVVKNDLLFYSLVPLRFVEAFRKKLNFHLEFFSDAGIKKFAKLITLFVVCDALCFAVKVYPMQTSERNLK